jgi:hypothetical protein
MIEPLARGLRAGMLWFYLVAACGPAGLPPPRQPLVATSGGVLPAQIPEVEPIQPVPVPPNALRVFPNGLTAIAVQFKGESPKLVYANWAPAFGSKCSYSALRWAARAMELTSNADPAASVRLQAAASPLGLTVSWSQGSGDLRTRLEQARAKIEAIRRPVELLMEEARRQLRRQSQDYDGEKNWVLLSQWLLDLPVEQIGVANSVLDAVPLGAAYECMYASLAPRSGVLIASSPLEPEAALQQMSDVFSSWQGRKLQVSDKVPLAWHRPEAGEPRVRVYPDRKAVRLTLGLPAPPLDAPDYIAFQAVHTLFARGGSSMLFKRLRVEEGRTYSIGAELVALGPGTLMHVAFVLTPDDQLNGAVRAMFETLAAAHELEYDALATDMTRQLAIAKWNASQQDDEHWIETAAYLFKMRLPVAETLAKWHEQFGALSGSNLQLAARQYLDPERAALLIAGPKALLGPRLQWLHMPVEAHWDE